MRRMTAASAGGAPLCSPGMSAIPADALVRATRGRTALHRTALSRPVSCAIEDGLIEDGKSVLDYGCGRGGDVERLRDQGFRAVGFDPVFFPDSSPQPADVVNLGYVVNVIEDEAERARVLKEAWALARSVLVVAARLKGEQRGLASGTQAQGDGIQTSAGTFQRFYAQEEFRDWVGVVTGSAPIAAEPGTLYLFREPARAELFLLSRTRKGRPRARKADAVFSKHEPLLRSLMAFVEDAGRLPVPGEFASEPELRSSVGTVRQAFRIIKTATGEEHWDRIRLEKYDELVVHLALSRFRRRPRFTDLPEVLQRDIKDFFGSYKAACEQGDRALFGIGEQGRRSAALEAAGVGKRTRGALYVHVSALPRLPVLLRVLEGAARELLGEVRDATLVKFDRARARVSYLAYPQFDVDPHPELRHAFLADLEEVRTGYLDYSGSKNPPVLHRKEHFVDDDYPRRNTFARLTRAEERAHLFDDASRIGRRDGWREALEQAGLELRGHRLLRLR